MMKHIIIAVLFVCIGVLHDILCNPALGIPSKEEQINLLTNVEEVFENIKLLVSDEGQSADRALVDDVEKIVRRAQDYITLLEDLALVKLSCLNKERSCVNTRRQTIQKTVLTGIKLLENCVEIARENIKQSSLAVNISTKAAMSNGQNLLDSLSNCTKKLGLQQISCYRKVINHDVLPLKLIMLDSISSHKAAHSKSLSVRDDANDCVDDTLGKYEEKIGRLLNESLTCI